MRHLRNFVDSKLYSFSFPSRVIGQTFAGVCEKQLRLRVKGKQDSLKNKSGLIMKNVIDASFESRLQVSDFLEKNIPAIIFSLKFMLFGFLCVH